jgi:hypothetical protein
MIGKLLIQLAEEGILIFVQLIEKPMRIEECVAVGCAYHLPTAQAAGAEVAAAIISREITNGETAVGQARRVRSQEKASRMREIYFHNI